MQSLFRFCQTRLQGTQSPPREFPNSGFQLLPVTQKFEEETLPAYKGYNYYPARIGDVLNSRYQIVGKLGYGTTSTVWMCRDLRKHAYYAIKIYIKSRSMGGNKEIEVFKHLSSVNSKHKGKANIRTMEDSFHIPGKDGGRHICIVHEPLGTSLAELQSLLDDQVFYEDLLKATTYELVVGLDFFHSEAKLIHTDLQAANIFLRINDPSVLEDYEKSEIERPTARKIDGERIIYQFRPLQPCFGLPVIADFGEVRWGNGEHTDDIMPDVYRAPEVILQMPWSYKVDIWNLGVLMWTLFYNRSLFRGRDPEGRISNAHHLAEMVALLGPPPKQVLKRSEISSKYFDQDGTWKGLVELPDISLEKLEDRLEGTDKERFLKFLRKLLQWDPDERPSARELVFDEWLSSE